MNPAHGPTGSDLAPNSPTFPINSAGLQNIPGEGPPIVPGDDEEQLKMFDYSQARIHLDRIIRDWDTEVEDTEVRRKTRDVELDVEGLRQKGELDEDETIIPVRTIDVNIQRELPAFINYLKNSRRLCTFRCLTTPNKDPQNIEKEFTEGMTYTAWETCHYKEIDGAESHGWAAVEVVFDTSKPLNVALEYIPHDKLFFPRTAENFQDCPRVIRGYDISVLKLREWVRKFDFDNEQVELLIKSRKDNQKENETLRIYKCYFKKEGIVYVTWFALTDGVNDWLRKPEQYDIGISEKIQVPVPIQVPIAAAPDGSPVMGTQMQMQEQWKPSPVKQYTIFILPYRETEKAKVVDHKGRCFYDEPKQEAQTAILSGFVNGLTRAANVYAAMGVEDGTGSSLKELEDIKLCGSRVLNKPVNFFSPPYPDALVIRSLQYFDTANSEETNQTNFAAMNREDSRKTAKEIGAAQQ